MINLSVLRDTISVINRLFDGLSVRRRRLQQSASSPRVMLPQQYLLVVDELSALRIHQLPPEMFVLQQIQEIQAHRILEELRVLRFLPVQQIFEVVDESRVFEEPTLG